MSRGKYLESIKPTWLQVGKPSPWEWKKVTGKTSSLAESRHRAYHQPGTQQAGTFQGSGVKPVYGFLENCCLEWDWGEADSKWDLMLVPQY